MRRKSERTASKKLKHSPEKREKLEKAKHTKTRRRKQSSSSASESDDETAPVNASEVVDTINTDPPKLAKEDSAKDSQDQVWQVKTTEVSGDVGEIKKLKLCLARPSSTPERVDRSPRSKRKHSRATSSSDTQSVEGEDKKKSKRRVKRCSESKDGEKNYESQGDETEVEFKEVSPLQTIVEAEQSASPNISSEETSESTTKDTTNEASTSEVTKNDITNEATTIKDVTNEAKTTEKATNEETVNEETGNEETTTEVTTTEVTTHEETIDEKTSNEDTTKCDSTEPNEAEKIGEKFDGDKTSESETLPDSSVQESQDTEKEPTSPNSDMGQDQNQYISFSVNESPVRKRSPSPEKSEILELHAEESRYESSEVSFNEPQDAKSKTTLDPDKDVSHFVPSEVSINKSNTEISGQPGFNNEDEITTNENIIEIAEKVEKDSQFEKDLNNQEEDNKDSKIEIMPQVNIGEKSHVSQTIPNGEAIPLVINRKRRWGSRPSKLSNQRSITISTEVLKEIIPDVKPVAFEEVIEEKKHKRIGIPDKVERPVLPKIVIDNTEHVEINKKDKKGVDKDKENVKFKDTHTPLVSMRKISIVKENNSIIARPPSPPRHKQSNILYITNLVRPFTLPQLKNLLQRTGRIVDNGFWIDRIKSKCFIKYETEDQAVETRHALHGVTWPVSNPKTLHVDFSTQEEFDNAKANEETDNAQVSTIPGTVEDWLLEQDKKRDKGEIEKPWERKAAMREWDVGKNEKTKEVSRQEKIHRDDRPPEKRRHRTIERSPEPARKFKKKEDEAPAKLLDDLFRKTKATPCIYWLPLSAETIAVKEEQRRQHMAEHERRLQELRRTHRRH